MEGASTAGQGRSEWTHEGRTKGFRVVPDGSFTRYQRSVYNRVDARSARREWVRVCVSIRVVPQKTLQAFVPAMAIAGTEVFFIFKSKGEIHYVKQDPAQIYT